MKKRVIAGIFAICMASHMALPVYAEEQQPTTVVVIDQETQTVYKNGVELTDLERMNYLTEVITGLRIDSDGTAHCTYALLPSNLNYSNYMTMTLQKSKNGTNWTDQHNWYIDVAVGVDCVYSGEDEKVSKGYQYRVKVRNKVFNGSNLLEEVVIFSDIESY